MQLCACACVWGGHRGVLLGGALWTWLLGRTPPHAHALAGAVWVRCGQAGPTQQHGLNPPRIAVLCYAMLCDAMRCYAGIAPFWLGCAGHGGGAVHLQPRVLLEAGRVRRRLFLLGHREPRDLVPDMVRIVNPSILAGWGSIRFSPLICTYAPWGARADEQTKSRKIPTRKILPFLLVPSGSAGGRSSARRALGCTCNPQRARVCHKGVMAGNSISFGSPHARCATPPRGCIVRQSCGGPNEIKKIPTLGFYLRALLLLLRQVPRVPWAPPVHAAGQQHHQEQAPHRGHLDGRVRLHHTERLGQPED